MTRTSQSQAARPAPCCRTLQSFTLRHEIFMLSTPRIRGGGSYSLSSTTTSVLTPSYKSIPGRAGLLLKPSGQFIATYVNSGVTHKLSLLCAVNSPPLTIHGGHLNQLVSSHSRLINKGRSVLQLVAVIFQGGCGIHPLWVTQCGDGDTAARSHVHCSCSAPGTGSARPHILVPCSAVRQSICT